MREGNLRTMRRIIKMNAPEWWQIVIGGLSAVVSGASMPVYAVVFGGVLGMLADPDDDFVRSQGNLYSLYFLIIGIVSGISTFMQVGVRTRFVTTVLLASLLLQWYFIGIAGERLTKRVRGVMFESILRQEVGWFDSPDNGVGALCAQLSGDAASIQGVSGQLVFLLRV